MKIIKTKKNIIIITMNETEALLKIGKTNLTIKKLKSKKNTFRMWVPVDYVGII